VAGVVLTGVQVDFLGERLHRGLRRAPQRGGEFANVASSWLMWTFKQDKKAGAMFVGKNCGLCTNANWDVQSTGIKG
jgi:hypothetical protein